MEAEFHALQTPAMGEEQNLLSTITDMQAALPPHCGQRRVLMAAICVSRTHEAARTCIKPLGRKLHASSGWNTGTPPFFSMDTHWKLHPRPGNGTQNHLLKMRCDFS
jgi:hypothetical protein